MFVIVILNIKNFILLFLKKTLLLMLFARVLKGKGKGFSETFKNQELVDKSVQM